MTEETQTATPLFREINADDTDPETTIIESICISCYKNGFTRLLLTKIPFYKEVVLMSFRCEHCGYSNNEIQSASEIQPRGCRITLNVNNAADLNRKIVKSDFTAVTIPEVNLEIPIQSQRGEVTTIEGIIERTIAGLCQDQEARYRDHPDDAKALDDYVRTLRELTNTNLQKPFKFFLEDISGNSFIENLNAPCVDPDCHTTYFTRTKEQDNILGLYNNIDTEENSEEPEENKNDNILKPIAEGSWPLEELHGEVLQFQTLCAECKSPCETNMKLTNIPHFKEVVIMATVCDTCGHKTNEVKSGGGIEEKGITFEVTINAPEDLNRDVLKSETCDMRIPELDCDVGQATLGGRFSTVEGILVAMKDQLKDNGALFHDSADVKTLERFNDFISKIEEIILMKRTATLILDDPAGNSYIQSLQDDGPDDKLKILHYERTFEQNEELGLNDMKTENY